MTPERIVSLMRLTMETSLFIAAPILAVAIIVGVLTSILQVVTSLQETTLATVPRLAAVALTTFALMPWLLRKMVTFAAMLFSDFRPYVGLR